MFLSFEGCMDENLNDGWKFEEKCCIMDEILALQEIIIFVIEKSI
jgi:hypothetical protein